MKLFQQLATFTVLSAAATGLFANSESPTSTTLDQPGFWDDGRLPKRKFPRFPMGDELARKYGYEKVPGVAQYKNGDWSNVVCRYDGISMADACMIAQDNPMIDYFFYTTAPVMMLEREDGNDMIFHYGDAVFFSGTPHWGSAKGMADGYLVNRVSAFHKTQ